MAPILSTVSREFPRDLPRGQRLSSAEGFYVDYFAHITRNPKICCGEPVIVGTRVTIRTILASLADGDNVQELLADFPTLTETDIRAVIAYAAASALEDLGISPLPTQRTHHSSPLVGTDS